MRRFYIGEWIVHVNVFVHGIFTVLVYGQRILNPMINRCPDSNLLEYVEDLQERVRNLEIAFSRLTIKESTQGTVVQANPKIEKPRDCLDIQQNLSPKKNGEFTIYAESSSPLTVLCDFDTDNGGWTIFHHRKDGTVDFYRNWNEYKVGFGNVSTEYWLGNDNIHRLSKLTGSNEMYVKVENWNGVKKYAKYSNFTVSDESDLYRLRISGYSGTAGDAMAANDNMMFTTKDRDNDIYSYTNCAIPYKGAWWYDACSPANLNGAYYYTDEYKGDCNKWYYFSYRREPLKETTMMIRRK